MKVTEKGVELARAVLKQAEETFAGYARHHKAKHDEASALTAPHAPTVDSLREKYERNRIMAALCREAWETGLMDIEPLIAKVKPDFNPDPPPCGGCPAGDVACRTPSCHKLRPKPLDVTGLQYHGDGKPIIGKIERCDPYSKTDGPSEK